MSFHGTLIKNSWSNYSIELRHSNCKRSETCHTTLHVDAIAAFEHGSTICLHTRRTLYWIAIAAWMQRFIFLISADEIAADDFDENGNFNMESAKLGKYKIIIRMNALMVAFLLR